MVWAIWFVDDFADGILAAWAKRSRLIAAAAANPASPERQGVLRSSCCRMSGRAAGCPRPGYTAAGGWLAPTSPPSPA